VVDRVRISHQGHCRRGAFWANCSECSRFVIRGDVVDLCLIGVWGRRDGKRPWIERYRLRPADGQPLPGIQPRRRITVVVTNLNEFMRIFANWVTRRGGVAQRVLFAHDAMSAGIADT